MECFAGIDLHSNNNQIGIIDGSGKRLFKKKNPNNLNLVLESLEPFGKELKGIVIESTFNWYWIVDGLMEAGYKVHLANPAAIGQYSGLKYCDDKSDAFWLAEMLRLNILPEGYIYPIKTRPIRDLLRKRMVLVRHRTALLLSVKGMISNSSGATISRNALKSLDYERLEQLLAHPHQVMAAHSLNEVISTFTEQIEKIEKAVLSEMSVKEEFRKLLTVNGIGEILGITIMLETGDIGRFKSVGDYSSYCRQVPSKRISNGKNKGSGNKKNGNRYLAWAFVEASHFMRRYNQKASKWHQKKAAKSGPIVATKALGNKIARACYFIMRDRVVFEPTRLFG
jgi:transposase